MITALFFLHFESLRGPQSSGFGLIGCSCRLRIGGHSPPLAGRCFTRDPGPISSIGTAPTPEMRLGSQSGLPGSSSFTHAMNPGPGAEIERLCQKFRPNVDTTDRAEIVLVLDRQPPEATDLPRRPRGNYLAVAGPAFTVPSASRTAWRRRVPSSRVDLIDRDCSALASFRSPFPDSTRTGSFRCLPLRVKAPSNRLFRASIAQSRIPRMVSRCRGRSA